MSDAPDLEQTWRWIEARPGAIAVSVVLEKPVGLVLVVRIEDGRRCISLLGVEVEASAVDPRRLPEEMKGVILQRRSDVPYAELAAWARRTIVEPVTAFLGHTPSTVLWVPDPWLRVVPPASIWGTTTALATATSLDLLDPYDYPGRHSSMLLGLADPGDLGQAGVNAFLGLVSEASGYGSVRVLASSGPRHGAAISTRPGVRNTPASIRDLLAESQEHRTLVLIAHGAVHDPMNAAIVCVDATGQKEYLDVAQLAAHPDAFAGAQVILLSCSSGPHLLVCAACMPDQDPPSCPLCRAPIPRIGAFDGFVHYAFAGLCPTCVAKVLAAGPARPASDVLAPARRASTPSCSASPASRSASALATAPSSTVSSTVAPSA